jgi:chromate reductase, NAD(P)H dehydrogenase (quinone)
MQILAVSGSLRVGSYNTSLLRAAIDAAPEGAEIDLFDPAGIADLPLYDEDLDAAGDVPESVSRLRNAWEAADAILFATPEYNGSVPGGLKNAVDWASRPNGRAALANKPVSVIGASPGRLGAMWAQADLRKILGVAGARVVGDELPVTRADQKFDHDGRLLDAELHELLRLVVTTLASEAVAPSRIAA